MSNRWSNPTRYTILIVLLFLLAAFLYVIRSLIGPLIIAALLAYMLYPLAKRLEVRTGGRYTLSVSLVYFPFLIILIATPGIVIPILIRQFQTLSGELFQVITQIEMLLARSVTFFGFTFSPESVKYVPESSVLFWLSFLSRAPPGAHL